MEVDNFMVKLCLVPQHVPITTGVTYFAKCPRRSAKDGKNSATPLLRTVLGKRHSAYTPQTNRILLSTVCRALGILIAEIQMGTLSKIK